MRTSRRTRMKALIGLVLATSALFSSPAHAGSIPELVNTLRQGMEWIEVSMDGEGACKADDAWYLRRFWLRLRPKATFTLPGLKVTLVPEVELLLERDYPDGWVTYKP